MVNTNLNIPLASVRQLRYVKRSLLAYNHYVSYTVPRISLAMGAIVLIVIAICVHSLFIDDYEVYHKFRLENLKNWIVPTFMGMLLGIAFGSIVFGLLHIGQPNTSFIAISDTGETSRQHPVRYINEAIYDRKTEIPKLQANVDHTYNEYQSKKHPSALEKRVVPSYENDQIHKIKQYKRFVNHAVKMKVTKSNYI